MTDREALEEKIFVYLNSVKHQFPGDAAMIWTLSSGLVSEVIESETEAAFAKGGEEEREKVRTVIDEWSEAAYKNKWINTEKYIGDDELAITLKSYLLGDGIVLAEGDAKGKL